MILSQLHSSCIMTFNLSFHTVRLHRCIFSCWTLCLCHCDMSCGLSNRFGQCWLIDLSVCVSWALTLQHDFTCTWSKQCYYWHNQTDTNNRADGQRLKKVSLVFVFFGLLCKVTITNVSSTSAAVGTFTFDYISLEEFLVFTTNTQYAEDNFSRVRCKFSNLCIDTSDCNWNFCLCRKNQYIYFLCCGSNVRLVVLGSGSQTASVTPSSYHWPTLRGLSWSPCKCMLGIVMLLKPGGALVKGKLFSGSCVNDYCIFNVKWFSVKCQDLLI